MNYRRLSPTLIFVPAGLAGFVLSFSAGAADVPGWYAGGGLGINIPADQNLSFANNGVTNKYSSGFVGGVRGGYAFSNGLRPELEFNYHHQAVNNVIVNAGYGTTQVGAPMGSVSAKTLMADLWYDFKQPEGFLSVVYPYVGAGVGVADVNFNSESFNSFVGNGGSANGSSTAFAYQFGFGADYDIIPTLTATFDFRYLMTTNVSIPGQVSNGGGSGQLSGEYKAPSLFIGLNYKFGGRDS